MDKIKTTIDSPNFKENKKKSVKFKTELEDKRHLSLPKKSFSNNFVFNLNIEPKDFLQLKSNYKYIINKINSLMKKINKNNYEEISSFLIKIKNAINKIIPNQILNKIKYNNLLKIYTERSDDIYNNDNYNSDASFISTNEKENGINSFNNFDLNTNEIITNYLKTNKDLKRLKILEQKNNEIEDKLKTQKLK